MTNDATFLIEFEACRWPLEKWRHRDHIKLAYLYLVDYPFDEALARIRTGIQAHNATHQVPDSRTAGYHETITQAWLRLVQFVLLESGHSDNADAFCDAHPELSQPKILRLYYSRERIMSQEAKTSFLGPDLAPFPQSRAK